MWNLVVSSLCKYIPLLLLCFIFFHGFSFGQCEYDPECIATCETLHRPGTQGDAICRQGCCIDADGNLAGDNVPLSCSSQCAEQKSDCEIGCSVGGALGACFALCEEAYEQCSNNCCQQDCQGDPAFCTCKCDGGIVLNTNVPFVGRCISIGGDTGDSTQLNAFPRLMKGLSRLLLSLILLLSFVMVIAGGVMIASSGASSSGYSEGKKLITKVVIGIALLGLMGVILRLINPNFFT